MKAKTLRPLTIVLLFGFLSTNGWMIVRDGPDHTVIRQITPGPALPGAGTRAHAAGPAAIPPPVGVASPGAAYAAPTGSSPHAAGTSGPYGASGGPAAPPAPGLDNPVLVTANYPDDPSGGFGAFGLPGAPAAAAAPNPRDGSGNAGSSPSSGRSGSGSSGGTGSGSGSSGNGSSGLLDPPGATSAPGSGGGSSVGGTGNHQVTVAEPSTLALFLAAAALMGLALSRRHAAR